MSDPMNPFVLDAKPRTRSILERRVDAAQATLERFRDKPFQVGKVDCVQVLKFHLRQLDRPLKYGRTLNYKSLLSGRAILKSMGHASIGDALSADYPEIAPAAALVGDLMELEALEDDKVTGLGAIVVYLGNGAVFGFHEGAVGGTVMRLPEGSAAIRAWRTIE